VHLPVLDKPEETRQFDVVLECPAGPRVFRLGIDVKDWTYALDVNEMAALIDKRNSVSLDRFIVIARSGYSAEAKRKAQNSNIELLSYENGAPIFAFSEVDVVIRTINNIAITIHYEVDPDPLPPMKDIDKILTRIDDQPPRGFAEAMYNYGMEVAAKLNAPDGGNLELILDNKPGHIKELIVEGITYPAPLWIEVKGTIGLQMLRVPSTQITTSEGVIASAIVFPHNGAVSQVTLVGAPNADGSTQLAATLGSAKPERLLLEGKWDAASQLRTLTVNAIEVPHPPARR
jgi:hypothetical protein